MFRLTYFWFFCVGLLACEQPSNQSTPSSTNTVATPSLVKDSLIFESGQDIEGFQSMALLNSDPFPDAIAIGATRELLLYLSTKDGTLAQPISVDTGQVQLCFSGDINNDRRIDLLVLSYHNPTIVRTFINQGNNSFKPGPTTMLSATLQAYEGKTVDRIQLADLNSDGNLDLFMNSRSSQKPYIIFRPGRGTGTFGAPYQIDLPVTPSNWYLEDLNGNDFPDLILLHQQVVFTLLNRGDRSFDPPQKLTLNFTPDRLQFGQFNNDLFVDIVVSGKDLGWQLLLNQGAGRFSKGDSRTVVVQGMATGFWDKDQRHDIIVSYSSDSIFTYFMNGAGEIKDSSIFAVVLKTPVTEVVDISHDGFSDIITLDQTTKTAHILHRKLIKVEDDQLP